MTWRVSVFQVFVCINFSLKTTKKYHVSYKSTSFNVFQIKFIEYRTTKIRAYFMFRHTNIKAQNCIYPFVLHTFLFLFFLFCFWYHFICDFFFLKMFSLFITIFISIFFVIICHFITVHSFIYFLFSFFLLSFLFF